MGADERGANPYVNHRGSEWLHIYTGVSVYFEQREYGS